MPVYAPTPGFASRRPHPRTLVLIVGGHAALLAAVMTAKMDLPAKIIPQITKVDLIEAPKPPPPPEPQPQPNPAPRDSVIDHVVPPLPIPQPRNLDVDTRPIPPDPGPLIGNVVEPVPDPRPIPLPLPDPVRVGPRFATPPGLVEPPYPEDKRQLEEQATLRLRISIDPRGRVVAVDPVGRADPSFLRAARRHIIANWRYKPATEDGKAVASSTVITLTFRLEA